MSGRKPFLDKIDMQTVVAMTEDGVLYDTLKKVQIVQEDNAKFLLMFSHIAAFMNGLDSLVDVKVMNWIADNMNYNDSVITLDKFYKEKIAEHVGFSHSAIEKSICSLTTKGFLVKFDCKRCARYHVNPSYVWYGEKTARDGKLKFVLELLQYQESPEKERAQIEDIKRYEEWYKKQSSSYKKPEKEEKNKSFKMSKDEDPEPIVQPSILTEEERESVYTK